MTPHERMRALIQQHGRNATSRQLLNPGFHYWFSEDNTAGVGYVRAHGMRVCGGVPVCDGAMVANAVSAFERDARDAGSDVVWFCVEESERRHFPDAASFMIGAKPVWTPAALLRTCETHASLRAQLNRARNKRIRVTRLDSTLPGRDDAPALRRCLHQWLERRGLPPLHFLVEPDILSDLTDRVVFCARLNDRPTGSNDRPTGSDGRPTHDDADAGRGHVVAYLVLSPIPQRDGWLVEQIVRGHQAPNGTAELLLYEAASWMETNATAMFTLGLSPLSRRAPSGLGSDADDAPAMVRMLFAWVRMHGRRFYNFEGLDVFKAKFRPTGWEAMYMVLSAGRAVTRRRALDALIAVGGAFGGTSTARFATRVTKHAVRAEMRALKEEVGAMRRKLLQ